MMTAEHRRPFAALMLLLAFACAVMANGLRDQVVQVFVDSGAPRPLISAVVPDIVLGHALRDAPQPEPAGASAESSGAAQEVEPATGGSAATEQVVTLVRSTSTPVRSAGAVTSGGNAGPGTSPGSGTPSEPEPPSVVPVVPVDPVQVPRPPLAPAKPGFGVDLPTTDDGVTRGHKPSKGVTADKSGTKRGWDSGKSRGRSIDRGHIHRGEKGGPDQPALGNGGQGSTPSTGARGPVVPNVDLDRGENRSNGWRSDGPDRVRHGDRDRGHKSRVRGHSDRGRDHSSNGGQRGRGHASHGGGHGKGHHH